MINTRQLIVTTVIFFVVICFFKIFSSDGASTVPVSKSDELPNARSLPNVSVQTNEFRTVIDAYEALQPSKKVASQADAEKSAAEAQERLNRRLEAQRQKLRADRPHFKMFDEKSQIGLVAIFREDSVVAVLQKVELASNESQYNKLLKGQSIGPYVLTEIGKLSVTLSSDTNQIKLELFANGNS